MWFMLGSSRSFTCDLDMWRECIRQYVRISNCLKYRTSNSLFNQILVTLANMYYLKLRQKKPFLKNSPSHIWCRRSDLSKGMGWAMAPVVLGVAIMRRRLLAGCQSWRTQVQVSWPLEARMVLKDVPLDRLHSPDKLALHFQRVTVSRPLSKNGWQRES